MHRAYNARLQQLEEESTAEFVARVWSTEDGLTRDLVAPSAELSQFTEDVFSVTEPEMVHKHLTGPHGTEICPSLVYQSLSEMMHLRLCEQAIAWDAELLLVGMVPSELPTAVSTICDAVWLCLRQVRVALATIAQEGGDYRALSLLHNPIDSFSLVTTREVPASGSRGERTQPAHPPLLSLAPLTPAEGLRHEVVQQLDADSSRYLSVIRNGTRPANQLMRDDELVVMGMMWRRSRAAHTALRGLERERGRLGDDFDVDGLQGRATRWVLVTEAASLLSIFSQTGQVSASAAACGSGLRSAYWLWLEDDDRSLSVLRGVLEQAARMRCWRKKPGRARRLEKRPQTTTRDWITDCGWRRLAALNNSLGEFSHFNAGSRYDGARSLLQQIHPDLDPELAPFLARGTSIDFVSHLVASETCLAMHELSTTVGECLSDLFDSLGLETCEDAEHFERVFDHMWKHRSASLGSPDFVGPAVDFWSNAADVELGQGPTSS